MIHWLQDYEKADERAEAAIRVARAGRSYPLLSGGDINLYSLFVERATALRKRRWHDWPPHALWNCLG